MTRNTIEQYFNNVVSKDLLGLVCSKKLGSGVSREVYQYALNPDYVIKFETDAGSFQNILEWETWENVRFTKHAKWFAPCSHISPCGTVLLQYYASPISSYDLPEKVPAFFTDLKLKNFGRFKDNIVCLDYGRNLLMSNGLTSRMKKAEW
jgi:hypothetical protein